MNILVIGNGFDIAHGLRTKYTDFLKFTREFEELYAHRDRKADIGWSDEYDKTFIKWIIEVFSEANKNDVYKDFVNEFHEMVFDNLWIGHFGVKEIKDGWIDFEKEISRVIQVLDNKRTNKCFMPDENTGDYRSRIENVVAEILSGYLGEEVIKLGTTTLPAIKDRLLRELNRATRALELYLAYYVEGEQLDMQKHRIAKLPIVEKLKIDKVISFNYTDTFERLYGPDGDGIVYEYIHGKAKKGIDAGTCNLVLGIDEYLNGSEKDTDNEYIEFKKFFQRIYKKTGSQYKVWIGRQKGNPVAKKDKNNVYFYGHSLDVTDKDIISDLIRMENSVATIFYHNRKSLGDQISNLVKILGEDELIERAGDFRPSIDFQTLDENDIFDIINERKSAFFHLDD